MLNRNHKLSRSLIKNYIFFSLTVGLVVSVLYPLFYVQVKGRLVDPTIPQLKASALIRQGCAPPSSGVIQSLGGWIKTLDENLRVVAVIGMDTDQRIGYSEQQLYQLFYDQEGAGEYYSLAPFQTAEGKTYQCLVHIPDGNATKEIRINKTPSYQLKTAAELGVGALALFLLLFALNVYLYSKWTARRITNPLEAIAGGIASMTAGNYRTRLAFKADFELAQIQDRFNFMAGQLDQVEQEKRTMEENRRRMLVDISHDLKTPITTIQGYAKALQLGFADTEEKRQKYLTYILTKANFVTALIEDIFALSKLESPDYRVEPEPSNLAESVREIAAHYYDQFEEKGIALHLHIPERKIMIDIDRKLMYRAISNIILNALKHNPSGTDVWLELADQGSAVQVTVADNGAGIPEHLKETLLQPFTRGDQARKSDGGTGLGLAIARQVMEKHGGTLLLDTDGGITAFRLVLKR